MKFGTLVLASLLALATAPMAACTQGPQQEPAAGGEGAPQASAGSARKFQPLATPRIVPVPASALTEADRKEGLGPYGADPSGAFRTCVINRPLCSAWGVFLNFFNEMPSKLSLSFRDKELVILRTCWLSDLDYVWSNHVGIGKTAGLTDEEIKRITGGPEVQGWSARDAAVLRAIDDLHKDQFVHDAAWKALDEHYDEKQIMEIIFLVGQYEMTAMFLNSMGTPLEPGKTGLPK